VKEETMIKQALTCVTLFGLALVFIGCAPPGAKKYRPELVQHMYGSVFDSTETGYYTTEVILRPNPPLVGRTKADLIVHDFRAVDRGGLKIQAELSLADTGEPAPEMPTVKEVRGPHRGLYEIAIYFHQPGDFELKLTIDGPFHDTVMLQIPTVEAAE
jgi:hypothetical protein